MIPSARPKTFCEDFGEQIEIAEKLYGQQVRFSFSYNDVKKIMDEAVVYPPEIRQRVTDIVMEQRRRYIYLFQPA